MEEQFLLQYARHQPDVSARPAPTQLATVIDRLRSRQPRIVFDWFRTHEDVLLNAETLKAEVTSESVARMLRMCVDRMTGREPRCVERINVFQLFGLLRMFAGGESIAREVLTNVDVRNFGLAFISAENFRLLHEQVAPEDTATAISDVRDLGLLDPYAHHQLFYYGGTKGFATAIRQYLGTAKEVFVPLALTAVLSSAPLRNPAASASLSEILELLEPKVRKLVTTNVSRKL